MLIASSLLLCLALFVPQVASAAIPDIVNDPFIRAMVPINELRDITGYNGPRTYLFLGQNSYELRTTGGFISRVGLIRFDHGDMNIIWLDYTYDLDYAYRDWLNDPAEPTHTAFKEDPPFPLTSLGTDSWYLRDRNWWPDFKVTARDIQTLFAKEARAYNASVPASETIPLSEPFAVDGVMAFDEDLGSRILAATGPITLDAPGKTYDNVVLNNQNFGLFSQWWEISGLETGSGGQGFFSTVSTAMRNALDSASADKQSAIAMVFIRALSEHRIQVYSNRTANQAALEKLDWAGRAIALAGDFLHVSDTNIGGPVAGKTYKGNKVNMYIRRSITKSVSLSASNGSSSEASMTYYNAGLPGYFGYFTDPNVTPPVVPDYGRLENAYYKGYNRVFVPANAMLDEAASVVDPPGSTARDTYESTMGRRWFGSWAGYYGVDPGTTKTIKYRYLIPGALLSVSNGYVYRLQVQKQGGTTADQFRFNFSSRYLRVTRVTGITPNSMTPQSVTYLGNLQYNKLLQISLTPIWMVRPTLSVRAGTVISLRGYASPAHVRSPAYFDVYRKIGGRYRRLAVLSARLVPYSSTARKFLARWRVPARGAYQVRARIAARTSRSFTTGWYRFGAR